MSFKVNNFFWCVFLFLFVAIGGYSQQTNSKIFTQLDFSPRWIWRGVSYSEGPVIQPSFGYSDNKFSAFIWGSYQILKGEFHEVDFAFEYKPIEQLKIGFTDYFGINDSIKHNQQFFNYKNQTTSHVFDFFVSVMPFKNIPLSFLVSNWFYGADKNTISKKQNYSTYLELRYDKQYNDINLYSFVGATPHNSFYFDKAGIVNVGIGCNKTYQVLKNLTMPLKLEFILNPSNENIYLNAVIGIK